MNQQRKPIVVANWKMHGTVALAEEIITGARHDKLLIPGARHDKLLASIDIVICPPAIYLAQIAQLITIKSPTSSLSPLPLIQLGAQNCYFRTEGAFTGEISPSMLYDIGCRYVIVGHSERRQLFGETDELIAKKCLAAYDAGLIPILCLGETAAERAAGKNFAIVGNQLQIVFEAIKTQATNTEKAKQSTAEPIWSKLILGYEPIWAIGTGQSATPELADEMHAYLRASAEAFEAGLGETLRIIYGGSVKAENAKALFSMPNIDGGLVGGASLNSKEFWEICSIACKLQTTASI